MYQATSQNDEALLRMLSSTHFANTVAEIVTWIEGGLYCKLEFVEGGGGDPLSIREVLAPASGLQAFHIRKSFTEVLLTALTGNGHAIPLVLV